MIQNILRLLDPDEFRRAIYGIFLDRSGVTHKPVENKHETMDRANYVNDYREQLKYKHR